MIKRKSFLEDTPRTRYVVEVEYLPGERTVILRTNSYDEAVRTCNFWDERRNTYFTDLAKRGLTETPAQLIERRCAELLAGLNKAVDQIKIPA